MPEKLMRCVEELKAQLRKDHPKWDAEKIEQVAYATCVKSTGQHPSDEESNVAIEVDCHKLAGDDSSNYAIPRLKALPYKSSSGPNKACVRNALARLNQVKGATSEEKARAKRVLQRAARSLGMDVGESVEPKKLAWTSNINVFESLDTAINSVINRKGVKVAYGLEEAKLEIQKESLHEGIDQIQPSDKHFYVVGDAIHATTTANLHTYLAEELEVATETLTGKPVMVDHSKESADNVGKVLVATWESREGIDSAITYIARIRKSHPVAEAIEVGDIDTVSIGATADFIECSVCGGDMLQCPHHLGKTYELENGERIVAAAIGRGLKFRELSITPFPADARASAYATNSSLYAAVETLVESSDNKYELQKAGATKKMSEDNIGELALAQQLEAMQAQLEQLQQEKESALDRVKTFQEEKKTSLVERVFEMEVAANIKESKDEVVRKTELKNMSVEHLQAMADTLKNVISTMEKMTPKSKAIVTEPVEEVKKAKPDPLVYKTSEVKAALREVMGMRTSPYAQKTVRRWALDGSNPMYREYKRIVSGNSAKLRGGNE